MMLLEGNIFSPAYRKMVSNLKKMLRQDIRDEEKIDDVRSGEGAGRKGPTSLQTGLSKSGYTRRSSRKKSGSIDNGTEKNSDTGTTTPPVREV